MFYNKKINLGQNFAFYINEQFESTYYTNLKFLLKYFIIVIISFLVLLTKFVNDVMIITFNNNLL